MTDITPMVAEGRQLIGSYGPGMFRVSGVVYRGSLIVFPDRTVTWAVNAFDELSEEVLAEVSVCEPPIEILLLGCGERMQPVPPTIRQALRREGIGIEPMDTGAACRTYNVLVAEGRRVAAGLIAL